MATVIIQEDGGSEPRKKFLITKRTKPAIDVTFPAQCPHCGEPAVRKRTIGRRMHTSTRSAETMIFEFGACATLKNPLAYYFAILPLAFIAVVAMLVALFSVLDSPTRLIGASAVAGACVLGIVMLWRRYSAIRFVSWGQGSVCFKVRDPTYAAKLAELNSGTVQ